MIKVKVIADSIYEGNRLTTIECEYPRIVHAQVLTHRTKSRNASSSRAQPVKKLNQKILDKPAMPYVWTANQPGMQGGPELTGWRLKYAKFIWKLATRAAVFCSNQLAWVGLHKQYSNRITEPYQYIKVVLSATDWDNFFDLRCDDEAQPEIMILALKIRKALEQSTPKELSIGEWHLPYITDAELDQHSIDELRVKSAARCCRVSYGTFGSERELSTMSQDLHTYDQLVSSEHLHASPLEHVAKAGFGTGNYTGWDQMRHMIENGHIPKYLA